jgi:hypothetical protein
MGCIFLGAVMLNGKPECSMCAVVMPAVCRTLERGSVRQTNFKRASGSTASSSTGNHGSNSHTYGQTVSLQLKLDFMGESQIIAKPLL